LFNINYVSKLLLIYTKLFAYLTITQSRSLIFLLLNQRCVESLNYVRLEYIWTARDCLMLALNQANLRIELLRIVIRLHFVCQRFANKKLWIAKQNIEITTHKTNKDSLKFDRVWDVLLDHCSRVLKNLLIERLDVGKY
jgi:hypothetical protein